MGAPQHQKLASEMNWDECWVVKDTHTAAGNGLFARQKIHQGQPIFRVCPEADVNMYVIYVVNHSCIPNMFALQGSVTSSWLLEGRFYAIRDIEAGEELTRCYDDHVLLEDSVFTRKVWMKAFWDFECLCPKCVGQWPDKYWYCPSDWIVDYRLPHHVLSQYFNALVRTWREGGKSKLCTKEKARIMAQRTVFSLQGFRDQVKATAEKLKKRTLDTRQKLRIGSRSIYDYTWSQNYDRLLED